MTETKNKKYKLPDEIDTYDIKIINENFINIDKDIQELETKTDRDSFPIRNNVDMS